MVFLLLSGTPAAPSMRSDGVIRSNSTDFFEEIEIGPGGHGLGPVWPLSRPTLETTGGMLVGVQK